MACIQVDGRQWGVGHGGFHTETVSLTTRTGGAKLRFIFDCGMTPRKATLDKAIESYIDELQAHAVRSNNRPEIDALYISHFHFDHISGIEKLITDLKAAGIKVKSVYAPLLSDFEKLCLVTSPLFVTGNNTPHPSARIVTNPTGWFSERLDIPPDSVHLLDEDPALPDSQNADDGQPDGTTPTKGVSQFGIGNVGTAQLKLWLCVPFVRSSHFSTANSTAAITEIRALIGSHESGFIKNDELKKLVSRKYLKDVRQIIKYHTAQQFNKAKKNHQIIDPSPMNFTSLCLYSGPNPDIANYICHCQRFSIRDNGLRQFDLSCWSCVDSGVQKPSVGWFGTGDADFTSWQAQNWISRTPKKKLLEFVDVINVPHHGSRKNSDATFWSLFPNAKFSLFNADGKSNNLPNIEVVNEAFLNGVMLFETSQGNRFKYQTHLHVHGV